MLAVAIMQTMPTINWSQRDTSGATRPADVLVVDDIVVGPPDYWFPVRFRTCAKRTIADLSLQGK